MLWLSPVRLAKSWRSTKGASTRGRRGVYEGVYGGTLQGQIEVDKELLEHCLTIQLFPSHVVVTPLVILLVETPVLVSCLRIVNTFFESVHDSVDEINLLLFGAGAFKIFIILNEVGIYAICAAKTSRIYHTVK